MENCSDLLSVEEITRLVEQFEQSLKEATEQFSEAFLKLQEALSECKDEDDYIHNTPYKPKTKPMYVKRKKPWELFYRRS